MISIAQQAAYFDAIHRNAVNSDFYVPPETYCFSKACSIAIHFEERSSRASGRAMICCAVDFFQEVARKFAISDALDFDFHVVSPLLMFLTYAMRY